MDETVGFAESGIALPIKIGRVDIPATLQETAAQQANRGRVGFYCGGKHVSRLFLCLCNCAHNPEGIWLPDV